MSDPTPQGPSSFEPPAATPATDTAVAHHGLAAAAGPDAHERPVPRLGIALAGAGGAVVAAGLTAIMVGDDGGRAMGIVAGLLILGISLAVRLVARRPPEAMSAALGAGVVGILVTVSAAMAEVDSVMWPALVLAVAFGLAWVLPGFQGRPLMLGLAAAMAVVGLVAVASELSSSGLTYEDCDRIYQEEGFEAMPEECFTGDLGSGNPVESLVKGDITPESIVAVLCGAGLMVAVLVLDRRGLHGTATPLVPVGIVATWAGLGAFVASLGDTGAAVLVLAGGLLIGFVGHAGQRRATTWWGAVITVAATIAFLVSVMEPSGTSDAGGALLIAGLLLIVASIVVVAMRGRTPAAPAGDPPAPVDPPSSFEPPAFPPPPAV